MPKICPNCKQPNFDQATFCSNCASPLAPAPAIGAPPQQQWNPQPGGAVMGQPSNQAGGASQRAIIALVLAIASLLCCGLLAGIPAAIVGWMELDAINRGQSSPAGKWMAQVGLWGGIGFSILHVIIWILWLLFSAVASSGRY